MLKNADLQIMKNTILNFLSVLLLALVTTGCSTAFNRPTDVRIDIRNASAVHVKVNGKEAGVTPAMVTMDPRQKYRLEFEKAGFQTLTTNVSPKFGWKGVAMVAGNVSSVVGSPIATVAMFGTDVATGSGYKSYPKEITFSMEVDPSPRGQGQLMGPGRLTDLPPPPPPSLYGAGSPRPGGFHQVTPMTTTNNQ